MMTNNKVSMFRQAEAQRDPDHPKICARCQLVWREYSPARDPHCHCFDHEYEDERREMERKDQLMLAAAEGQEKLRQRIASLERTVGEQADQIGGLTSELARLRQLYIAENHDIEQCLGQVLGYPWYKDDLRNFPNATEQDGVCVGEHTAVSLSAEAAETIKQLRQKLTEEHEWHHEALASGQAISNERDALRQQLAASQVEAAALRRALEAMQAAWHHKLYCKIEHCAFGMRSCIEQLNLNKTATDLTDVALAAPSAATEYMRLLEDLTRAVRQYRYWRNKYLNEPKVTCMSPARAFEDVETALAALDAATGEKALTVEEVKGDG